MEFKSGDQVQFRRAFAEGSGVQKSRLAEYRGAVDRVEGDVVFVKWGGGGVGEHGVHWRSLEIVPQ